MTGPDQVNTFHGNSDVDSSQLAQHHTLGLDNNQSSPGSHKHQGSDSLRLVASDLRPPAGSGMGDLLVAGVGGGSVTRVPAGASGQYLVAEPSLTPGARWVAMPGKLMAVRAVSTTNISIATPGGSLTVDGVSLASGDRLLLAGQTAGAENGVYVYNGAAALSRALDAAIFIPQGVEVNVLAGTVYGFTTWRNTNTGAITVNTTVQTWSTVNEALLRLGATGQYGWMVAAGLTSWSVSATNATTITISYGVTFSAVPILVCVCQTTSLHRFFPFLNGPPGLSSANVRIEQGEDAADTASGNLHWIVMGPP